MNCEKYLNVFCYREHKTYSNKFKKYLKTKKNIIFIEISWNLGYLQNVVIC